MDNTKTTNETPTTDRRILSKWTEVANDAVHDAALNLARGSYQRDLLLGGENLSGSTLSGKARSYGGKYKRSREALLQRMTAVGIPWHVETRAKGRRVLVVG